MVETNIFMLTVVCSSNFLMKEMQYEKESFKDKASIDACSENKMCLMVDPRSCPPGPKYS